MFAKALLLASFLFISWANAIVKGDESCADKDLNAAEDSPLRHIPIYDQSESRTCYAHAAATILNYYRIKHGGSEADNINPIYAAYVSSYAAHNSRVRSSTLNGEVVDVIDDLRSYGYCSPDKVDASLKDFKKIGGLTDAGLVAFLDKVSNADASKPRNASGMNLPPNQQSVPDPQLFESCKLDALRKLLQSKEILNVATTKALELMFQKCLPPKPLLNVPAPRNYRDSSESGLISHADRALDEDSPPALNICDAMLIDPNYRGYEKKEVGNYNPIRRYQTALRGREAPQNQPEDCEQHAIVLTARKKFPKGCSYLIRNSWGATWAPPNVDCACTNAAGAYEAICSDRSKATEFLGCWYPRSLIMANMSRVTVL